MLLRFDRASALPTRFTTAVVDPQPFFRIGAASGTPHPHVGCYSVTRSLSYVRLQEFASGRNEATQLCNGERARCPERIHTAREANFRFIDVANPGQNRLLQKGH